MKYVRKSKKSVVPRRKPVFKRKAAYSKRTRPVRIVDPTVVKVNPGKSRVQRWVKTTPINTQGVPSFPGTNGFSIFCSGLSYQVAGVMTFDPTGNYGNVSGSITSPATTFSTLSPQTLPEWTSFSNLYAQYKVNKIHLKFTYSDNGANAQASASAATLWMRYNDEYQPGNPTAVSISEEKNWIKKIFTAEHPNFTYSFYPKCLTFYDNQGAISTDGRGSRSMGWCNMNAPAEIFGMKFFCQTQAVGTVDAGYIHCDIQYDLSFKEQT